MIGLSRRTGQLLAGWVYFIQLAEDALTTQLASREKNREYGSRLPELLGDISGDDTLMLAQIYATETFIHPPNKLHTLFNVEQIVARRADGGIRLTIRGQYLAQNNTASSQQFEVPLHAA